MQHEDILNEAVNGLTVLARGYGYAGEKIDREAYATGLLNHIRKLWDEENKLNRLSSVERDELKQGGWLGDHPYCLSLDCDVCAEREYYESDRK